MDNLAHALAGAALGEAGLKRWTGLGMAALIVGANLPDVDVLGLLVGENLAWRRGWTHGPLGLLLLPPLLAAALIALDRWQGGRGRRPAARPPVRPGPLLALAYAGALSHPLLDLLNTYGVRLLMPFSDRWFYGDTLFIIDVWLWTLLAAGVLLSRRRARAGHPAPARPALTGLLLACSYVGAMGLGSAQAARLAQAAAEARGLRPVDAAVASPVPVDPFRRDLVVRADGRLLFGELRFAPGPRLSMSPAAAPTNMADPAVAAAAGRSKDVADFLYWSRLPFARVERRADGAVVTVADARYSDGSTPGRFSVTARVPAAGEASARTDRPPTSAGRAPDWPAGN